MAGNEITVAITNRMPPATFVFWRSVAWTSRCTRLSYVMNGKDLQAPEDDAYDLVIDIAESTLAEIPKIAEVLAPWVSEQP
ncbi:MAG: hypothetical protein ACR2KG_04200 [Nocardioidaceae bacterium]